MKDKILVGRRVKYIGNDHDSNPRCYPPKGTLGTVIVDKSDVDDTIEVEWDSGTSDDRKWWTSPRDVEIVKPFGKFESVDAVIKAYESLEKEYTRKCQTLRKLKDVLANGSEINVGIRECSKCDYMLRCEECAHTKQYVIEKLKTKFHEKFNELYSFTSGTLAEWEQLGPVDILEVFDEACKEAMEENV
jgi:hypothetical protein